MIKYIKVSILMLILQMVNISPARVIVGANFPTSVKLILDNHSEQTKMISPGETFDFDAVFAGFSAIAWLKNGAMYEAPMRIKGIEGTRSVKIDKNSNVVNISKGSSVFAAEPAFTTTGYPAPQTSTRTQTQAALDDITVYSNFSTKITVKNNTNAEEQSEFISPGTQDPKKIRRFPGVITLQWDEGIKKYQVEFSSNETKYIHIRENGDVLISDSDIRENKGLEWKSITDRVILLKNAYQENRF